MSSVARLASRLRTSPSYVFGRFTTVRRIYALGQGLTRSESAPLTAVPPLGTDGDPIARGPSGLVRSHRTGGEHCAALRARSWSDGIALTAEGVEALRAFAHNSPLRFRRGVDQFDAVESIAELDEADRGGVTTATLSSAWRDPTVRAITGDPAILDMVTRYLGYPPRLAMPYSSGASPTTSTSPSASHATRPCSSTMTCRAIISLM